MPAFEDMKDVHMAHRKIGQKKYKYGITMLENMKWEEGYVDPKFKNNHKLTTSKTPEYHAEKFLPFSRNMKGNKEMISFEKITKWEKLKAVFYGAGQGGTCYNDFRPFKVRELCQNFGLYIIHRINPSTRVEMKFKL